MLKGEVFLESLGTRFLECCEKKFFKKLEMKGYCLRIQIMRNTKEEIIRLGQKRYIESLMYRRN